MKRCGIFCTQCDCGRRRVRCKFKNSFFPTNYKWMEFGLIFAYVHTGALS